MNESGHISTPIPYFGKGRNAIQSRFANVLVRVLNAILRLKIIRDKSATKDDVLWATEGLTLVLAGEIQDSSEPTNVSVKRAVITSVAEDYLVATQWDDAEESFTGGSVNIAKPPELRANLGETSYGIAITYDGYDSEANQREATYNDADGDPATVIQRVYPPYREDDEIFFAETTEKVGVSTYTRIDVNADARHWRTETDGCDSDGNPIYSFVARSPWRSTAEGSSWA